MPFATPNEWKGLPRPELAALRQLATKCHDGKNDAADAAAICEAVQRPNMRFVPIKTADQPSRLMVDRARQSFVVERTAMINRIRGLLAEFGVVLAQKAEVIRREATHHLDDLPGYGKTVIEDLLAEVRHLEAALAGARTRWQCHSGTTMRSCSLVQCLETALGCGTALQREYP